METSGRGNTEAMWTHSKNRNNDNFQSFIYLRVKGQGFHWPEIPEAWLLSTTPVVLQRNPHGVLCGSSFWQRGSCFTSWLCFVPMHDILGRHGPWKLYFCLPIAYDPRGKTCSRFLRLCVFACVHACTFMCSLSGDTTSKWVHRHFFLSWRKGSFAVANTEELNWIFVEWGEGNPVSLVELSKAIGGCLFPLRRDVVCWLILNYSDSVQDNQLENFKCLNWPFEHWGSRIIWSPTCPVRGCQGNSSLSSNSLRPFPFPLRLVTGPEACFLYSTNSDCCLRSIFSSAWGKGGGPNGVNRIRSWLWPSYKDFEKIGLHWVNLEI